MKLFSKILLNTILPIVLNVVLFQNAFAQISGSTYDYRSGNSYNWRRNYDNSITVNGYNARTGSTWRNNIKANGDMNGVDKRGNYWNYNSRTKSYTNFGTGKTCYGTGYGRVCNN